MFCTDSKDDRILNAMKKVVNLFQDQRFIDRMKQLGFPEDSNASFTEIINLIKKYVDEHCIQIDTYKPWYWRSKAVARFQPKKPNTVQLNERKLNNFTIEPRGKIISEHQDASIAGRIVHELTHLVDYHEDGYRFGHGGNKSKGKGFTAPYMMGKTAKRFILENY